jgi:hypothetical protein
MYKLHLRTLLLCSLLAIKAMGAGAFVECEGYFVRKATRDTVRTIILVPTDPSNRKVMLFSKLVYSVLVKDPFSMIDLKKRPEDLIAFGFVYDRRSYEFWSVPNVFDKPGSNLGKEVAQVFAWIKIKGRCKLVAFASKEPASANQAEYWVKHNHREWLLLSHNSWQKNLASYLSDCTPVAAKLNGADLSIGQLEQVIREYNLCSNPKP